MAADFDEAKERAAFEAEYTRLAGPGFKPRWLRLWADNGAYMSQDVERVWQLWKTARHQPSAPALPVVAIKAAIHALEEDSELSLQCAMIPPIGGEVSNKHLQQSKDSDRHAAALRALLPPTEQ